MPVWTLQNVEAEAMPHSAFENSHHPERNMAIVESRLAGKSCRAIGLEYGLSHQRIRQIVESYQRYERYAALAAEEAALSEEERAAREKRREEEEWAELLEHDRRNSERWALEDARHEAEKEKVFYDLARTPAMEDAILHVQKTLGCDRETARQKLLERFFGD
jgi:transposase